MSVVADVPPTIPSYIDTHTMRATYRGVEYVWVGGFGAILQSHERGISVGNCRMIGNVLFSAYMVSRSGWKREVGWTVDGVDAEWIRRFKRAFFGMNN